MNVLQIEPPTLGLPRGSKKARRKNKNMHPVGSKKSTAEDPKKHPKAHLSHPQKKTRFFTCVEEFGRIVVNDFFLNFGA